MHHGEEVWRCGVVKKGGLFHFTYDKYLGIDGAPSVIYVNVFFINSQNTLFREKKFFFFQLLHLQVLILFYILPFVLVNGHVVVVGFTE